MSINIVIKDSFYSYLRQIIGLIVGIVSLPLVLNEFGAVIYGVWALITSVVMYLNTVSFGIPTAMQTLVAKTSNLYQKNQILKISFYLLFTMATITLAIFMLAINYSSDWVILFLGNIDDDFVDIAKQLFIIYVVATLIKMPLSLYPNFFVGMNKVYISEIYQIITLLLNLIIVLVCVYFEFDILLFSILMLSVQVFSNVASLLHVLLKFAYLKYQPKSLKHPDEVSTRKILRSGFAFFQVGVAASVVWSTDNLIISHFLSPEQITPYAIAFKIFAFTLIFSTVINGVIGPLYGNAYSIRDYTTIKKYSSVIFKFLPIVSIFVWMSLLFFSKEVVELWTNEDSFGGYLLFFSLGFYGYILSYVTTYATVIWSLNKAKKTLFVVWGEAILNLILSIILIQFLGIGGVALATAFSSLLTGFVFLPKMLKKITDGGVSYDFSYIKNQFYFLVMPFITIAVLSIFIQDIKLKIFLFFLSVALYILSTSFVLTKEDKMIFWNVLNKIKRR